MKKLFYIVLLIGAGTVFRAADGMVQPAEREKEPPISSFPEEDSFVAAARAFAAGDDERTAELIMAAVRAEPLCLAVLWDPRFSKWLPPSPCREIESLSPLEVTGDPAPAALYRLGLTRKNSVRERAGELAARKAGQYFLVRTVRDFRESTWAAEAALVLLEDEACLTDAGYPDCSVHLIREYEKWLHVFPRSPGRRRVLLRMAEEYQRLAERFEEDAPWKSAVRAELCRGRALELAEIIVRGGERDQETEAAMKLAAEIRSSGQPFSLLPPEAVSESRRQKKEQEMELRFSALESWLGE